MGILSLPLRPVDYIGTAWGWIPPPLVVVPVYVPALVAFLGGPHFSVGIGIGAGLVGWFPLGPREPFFPWYHYSGIYLNVVNITNIRNVTNITNITNINNIHYAYKTIATTAVPTSVFSSGQPVAHHVVRVPPEQLEKAEIIPHPPANPTRSALTPGKPLSPPPVRIQRLVAANKNAEVAGRPAHAQNRQKRPAGNSARTPPPEVRGKPQPSTRMSPPRLITRATPPPPTIPVPTNACRNVRTSRTTSRAATDQSFAVRKAGGPDARQRISAAPSSSPSRETGHHAASHAKSPTVTVGIPISKMVRRIMGIVRSMNKRRRTRK